MRTKGGSGFRMVKCFHTPSLHATIVSPDAVGHQLGCRGYTSVSNFDGVDCQIRLHHCRRTSEDIVMALTLRRGLLYSDPLILPSSSEHSGPLPRPLLYVHKVERVSPDDELAEDDASSASTAPADNRTDSAADDSVPTVETVDDENATAEVDITLPDDDVIDMFDVQEIASVEPASCACNAAPSSSCACHSTPEDPTCMPCSDTGSSCTDLPFQCDCCKMAPPDEHDALSMSLAEKMLLFQRLGSQFDIPLEELHMHALGVPAFDPTCPSVCGHSSPDSDSTSSPADTLVDASTDSNDGDTPTYMDPDEEYILCHVSRDQLRILWHQRLGHMHSRRVSKMHKHADGIPPIPIATELDACPVCAHAKLRKAARGLESTRLRATQPGQGIGVDFGFMVQQSKNSQRMERLQGLNGETCYCLVVDHFSGRLYGECFASKAPPIDFLNRWLLLHGLPKDVPNKYVRMDNGGELGNCRAIVDLFENAGYAVEPTAPDSSHQNGPVERPHQTIADAIRTMLGGAGLPPKFWPYAFYHFLRLYNVTPHGDKASPYTIENGKNPNLSHLRVFGCRVYALPARPHRPDKLVSDGRVGTFLGFSKTMKNVLYFDLETETVKPAQHVAFDESMNDLDFKPPNARLLDGLRSGKLEDIMDLEVPVPNLDVSLRPFCDTVTVTMKLDLDADSPLHMEFDTCHRLLRAYVRKFNKLPVGNRSRKFRSDNVGSYIVSIDDTPVFSIADIDAVLDRLRSSPVPPATLHVELAKERRTDHNPRATPLHLRMHDLQRVCALQSVAGEGMTYDEYRGVVDEFASDLTPMEMSAVISRLQTEDAHVHRLQAETMTPEEQRLKKFTRANLMKLPNWTKWDEAFDAQLDSHRESGALAEPIPRSEARGVNGKKPNILRVHWQNVVKTDGTRKCRACMDGSKRAAPWLRQFVQTYASCIEQPCMRLFFALSAALGLTIVFADTKNAYQQSPPPTEQCYLEIDDAYRSWYKKRFGKDLDPRKYVIPVNRALQGHPEAGVLWEKMIVGILEGEELGFKSTTHERNLYRGTIDDETVLVCRQVDDFAIASKSRAAADKLIDSINKHVTTDNQGIGIRNDDGVHSGTMG